MSIPELLCHTISHRALPSQSVQLAGLGPQEALAAAEETLTAYRELATARPDTFDGTAGTLAKAG